MTTSNDDLDLKNLWQDSVAPDVDELLVGVRKTRTRMWQLLAIEVLGTVAALLLLTIYAIWGVFGDRLWPAIAVGVVAIVVQIWTWRWRRGLWRALSDAPIDLLRLQRKRTLANLKIARYYAWGTPLSLPFGLAFAWLSVDESFSMGLSGPVRLGIVIAAALLLVLMTVYGFRMARRCQRELAQIDARIAELEFDAK